MQMIVDSITFFIYLLMCHLLGDYVLQIDYIAQTKKINPYHLFVHCVLYVVPFVFLYKDIPNGYLIYIYLFFTHFVIDASKCDEKIDYKTDQILHYGVLFILWLAHICHVF